MAFPYMFNRFSLHVGSAFTEIFAHLEIQCCLARIVYQEAAHALLLFFTLWLTSVVSPQ